MKAIHTKNTAYLAVAAASAQFATTMAEGQVYILTSTTAAWALVAANPTAVARTTGNIYIPPNVPIEIVAQGTALKVALIRDAADGHASLTQAL